MGRSDRRGLIIGWGWAACGPLRLTCQFPSGVLPTAYSASKAAVVSLTRNAASELAEHRIRVNAVCPGIIFTPLMHNGREAQAEAVVREIQPWPDRGEPHHVASAVLYLASDESRFMTGAELKLDGGLSAA